MWRHADLSPNCHVSLLCFVFGSNLSGYQFFSDVVVMKTSFCQSCLDGGRCFCWWNWLFITRNTTLLLYCMQTNKGSAVFCSCVGEVEATCKTTGLKVVTQATHLWGNEVLPLLAFFVGFSIFSYVSLCPFFLYPCYSKELSWLEEWQAATMLVDHQPVLSPNPRRPEECEALSIRRQARVVVWVQQPAYWNRLMMDGLAAVAAPPIACQN